MVLASTFILVLITNVLPENFRWLFKNISGKVSVLHCSFVLKILINYVVWFAVDLTAL